MIEIKKEKSAKNQKRRKVRRSRANKKIKIKIISKFNRTGKKMNREMKIDEKEKWC